MEKIRDVEISGIEGSLEVRELIVSYVIYIEEENIQGNVKDVDI